LPASNDPIPTSRDADDTGCKVKEQQAACSRQLVQTTNHDDKEELPMQKPEEKIRNRRWRFASWLLACLNNFQS